MIPTKNTLVGWQVFWIGDLYDTGVTSYDSMMHGSRAKARDQMRGMKAQPWTFKNVFMCRVSVNKNSNLVYEKAR